MGTGSNERWRGKMEEVMLGRWWGRGTAAIKGAASLLERPPTTASIRTPTPRDRRATEQKEGMVVGTLLVRQILAEMVAAGAGLQLAMARADGQQSSSSAGSMTYPADQRAALIHTTLLCALLSPDAPTHMHAAE